MKTCKSPTTNTPSDLRHPWSRKTFSLCRHKTKGRLPLQRRGPGLRKFQISRAFHFKSHRVLTKEQGKISLCLTKTISACGLVEFFWSSFVSSLCPVENKYLNLSLKFKHFPIISKQTLCALQATRPYSHSDSHDGWHVKYEVFPCLAEEFFEFCSSSWFVHVVQGNMSMLSNKSKSSKTFVAFRCKHCKGEYRTQRAYDCHRRHQAYVHTPCADPRNQRSVTFTERADLSTGILQEHAVSYFGNICHNACHLCCNGINHAWHFHTSLHFITHNHT